MGALLIASCLEICGCSPVRDCQRVLGLQMSSLDWTTLVERCSPCLTAQEFSTLKEGRGRFLMAGNTMPFRPGETVRDALYENRGPSFNEVAATSGRPDPALQISDFHSLKTPTPFSRATPSEDKFVPSSIPESVLFLFEETQSDAASERVPIATAFVLSVPRPGSRTRARFLVTARHVVDPAWAHCSERNPASIQVRLNRRSGGVGYETLPLTDGHGPIFITPSDPTADIAIIRLDLDLIPNIDSYKFVDTPFQLLPTDSELGLISSSQRDDSRNFPGQQVTTASLRTQVPADLNAFPISQSGVLSSTAYEPVNMQCGNKAALRPLRVWFVDVPVEPGVSGAPVYTSLSRDGETSPSTVLVGVQAIAWPDRGVVGITPASALAELVESALATGDHGHSRREYFGREQRADLHRGATP